MHKNLQIGPVDVFAAPRERSGLGRTHRHRSLVGERVFKSYGRFCPDAVRALIQGADPAHLVNGFDNGVLLQVFADPRQVMYSRDSASLKEFACPIPDSYSKWGDPVVPADRMTSALAEAIARWPWVNIWSPTARLPLNKTAVACVFSRTRRLCRDRTG